MSQQHQDELMALWGATLMHLDTDASPPFMNHKEILSKIDAIEHGEVSWDFFDLGYSEQKIPENNPLSWMFQRYRVWYRDALSVAEKILKNGDFEAEFDYAPYKDYNEAGERCWNNFMSGDWAWQQAVNISNYTVLGSNF